MTTINTEQVLTDYQGKPLTNGDRDLTIGDVISLTLGGQVSNPTLGWQLGKKFATEKTVELKAEDVVFIKKELGESKGFTAIVIGQVLDLLDSPNSSKTVHESHEKPKDDK